MALDFPIHFFKRPVDSAFEEATIHIAHEIIAQRKYVQDLRLQEAARGLSVAFHFSEGHVCTTQCHLVPYPTGDVVYDCPRPLEHPASLRNPDNSVMHRWSADVLICYDYGVAHVCTAEYCTRQRNIDGEMICDLTRKCLGSVIAAVVERGGGMCFESGKPLTTVETQAVSTDAIQARQHAFEDTLPENAGRRQQLITASQDAQQGKDSHKRTLDVARMIGVRNRNQTAGTIGQIGTGGEAKLLITGKAPETSKAPPIADPVDITRPIISNTFAAAAELSLFAAISSAGNRPTGDQIESTFASLVNDLFDRLETAYSLAKRQEELQACEAEFVGHYSGRRKARVRRTNPAVAALSAPPTISMSTLLTTHRRYTARALEGMEYVWIMSACQAWASGEIRLAESKRLVSRMVRMWDAIRRTPKFQKQPRPHLYQRIAGCLLQLVIDGHDTPACLSRAKRSSFFMPCRHRTTATSASMQCAHEQMTLKLVEPSFVMQCLLGPLGMRRRALDPVCKHTLSHLNDIIGLYDSQMAQGLRVSDHKKYFYVPDVD